MNLEECGLNLFHCDTCNDTGQILWTDENGMLYSRNCECMSRRLSLRRWKQSGLDSLIKRCTFESYTAPDNQTAAIKEIALQYCGSSPAWFYIFGRPGSGKTHICTAMCSRFLQSGDNVQYIVWPDEIGKLKAMKAGDPPDPNYSIELERLKTTAVLYMDDFMKGKTTAADMKIAFEILNARYNNPSLRTIISSEITPDQIGDKAIQGRITERAREYVVKAPERNWRK